jgi:hypothetical protein
MKKLKKKVALRKETVRALTNKELAYAAGGDVLEADSGPRACTAPAFAAAWN